MEQIRNIAGASNVPLPAYGDGGEYELMRDIETAKSHIRDSGIPERYRAADVARCAPEIAAYAGRFTRSTPDGLILTGGCGTGKTYSACAVLNEAAKVCTVKIATMQDIIAEVSSNTGFGESANAARARYKNVRLLVIDDLGKERATRKEAPIVYEIINARYAGGRPTIITSNYTSAGLLEHFSEYADVETAESLVSRICEMCAPVHFDGEDMRIARGTVGASARLENE